MRLMLCFGVLSAIVMPGSLSAAVLLGSEVSVEYRTPDLMTPYGPTTYDPQVFVVGAGQESAVTIEGVTTFNIDFTDTALNILFDTTLANPSLGNQSFNGLVFTSASFNQITGVSVDGVTNLAGFDASRVTVVGDELRIDFSGQGYNTDSVLALTFASSVSAIPEPASWAMMLAGCGLMGGMLRSAKRQKALVSFA